MRSDYSDMFPGFGTDSGKRGSVGEREILDLIFRNKPLAPVATPPEPARAMLGYADTDSLFVSEMREALAGRDRFMLNSLYGKFGAKRSDPF